MSWMNSVKIKVLHLKKREGVAICADDPELRHYKELKELPPHRLAEIRRFFEDCILCLSVFHIIVNICSR